jgi:hypothetical protein
MLLMCEDLTENQLYYFVLTRNDSQRKVRDPFDNNLESWSNTYYPQIFFQNRRMKWSLKHIEKRKFIFLWQLTSIFTVFNRRALLMLKYIERKICFLKTDLWIVCVTSTFHLIIKWLPYFTLGIIPRKCTFKAK